MADLVAGHIVLGQDLDAVGMLKRLRYIHTVDARARILRENGLRVDHAVKGQIVCVKTAAVDLLGRVDTLRMLVHVQFFLRSGDLSLLAEEIRRQHDGILYFLITGTAAEIALDRRFHVLSGGVKVHVQQALCGNDHAGDTETALNGSRLREAMLVNPHLLRGDTLNGQDLLALEFA